jgi:hypothetical protein
MRRSAVLIFVAAVLAGCYRKSPPDRPAGVPSGAVWAGGLDGGSFILCGVNPARKVNPCTVYNDYTGQIMERGDFRLKAEDRAVGAEELKYAWADRGGMIGLADGRVLKRVHVPTQ